MFNRIVKLCLAAAWYGLVLVPERIFSAGTKRLTIITYHGIRSDQKPGFTSQMRAVLKAGKPSGPDIKSREMGRGNHIAVTFDDGYENLLENAFPILEQLSIPAAVFMTAGYMGQRPGWYDDPETEDSGSLLNSEQLCGLNTDLITVGSHGFYHRDMPGIEPEEASAEYSGSKASLEDLLGRTVDLFAFPFGTWSEALVELGEDSGYRYLYRNTPYPAGIHADTGLRGRISVSPHDWRPEFWLKIRGAYDFLPYAIALKGRIQR